MGRRGTVQADEQRHADEQCAVHWVACEGLGATAWVRGVGEVGRRDFPTARKREGISF